MTEHDNERFSPVTLKMKMGCGAAKVAPVSMNRPPCLDVPEDEETVLHETISPPCIWGNTHASLLNGSPCQHTDSLRNFEHWYRTRLLIANASYKWSPSRSDAFVAMADLWIRMCRKRKPSPRVAAPVPPLPPSPPHVLLAEESAILRST